MKGIPESGKVVFDEFVKQRLGDEPTKGYWKPMQKCTILTFADMKQNLPNDKDRKLIIDSEVLFRQLLGVSKSRDVDLSKAFQYELAAIPLALFHGDGTMRKTNKADLVKKLESNCPDAATDTNVHFIRKYHRWHGNGSIAKREPLQNVRRFGRSGSETYSSASQQPVRGVELCDHCLRSL